MNRQELEIIINLIDEKIVEQDEDFTDPDFNSEEEIEFTNGYINELYELRSKIENIRNLH